MNKNAKDIEKKINNIFESVFKKVFNLKTIGDIIVDKYSIKKAIQNISKSVQWNEFCKKVSKQLALKGLNKQKRLWKKYFEAAKKAHYGVLESTYTAFEKKILSNVIKENFKMIKSIPQDVLKVFEHKYAKTLITQVVEGKIGRKAFVMQLKSHGHKNAKLIARTETAKLQSIILEQRSTALGSICYQWRSSNDKRTRKSHRDMNNVIVFWRPLAQKPLLDNMRGNAGEFPNCRCTPQPILDETDLKTAMYNVYDYRTDKIIVLRRIDLIKAIDRGEL